MQLREVEQHMDTATVILCIGTALIAIIGIGFFFGIRQKNNKTVYAKSKRIQALRTLNGTTQFFHFQPSYYNHQSCNSKRQLDHFSMNEYLIALIDENEEFCRHLLFMVSQNIERYDAYMRQADTLKTSATEDFCQAFGFSLSKFLKYEERLFKKNLLKKPQTDVIIQCKATYVSPKGRNHYSREQSYNYLDLKFYFERTIDLKKHRQTRQYQIKLERAKMTDSLRYDILKRDHFRCQICGSCAQDGVKLHVDHIIPVSKGGKTVASNLRTLCDRCNMGKSDKI